MTASDQHFSNQIFGYFTVEIAGLLSWNKHALQKSLHKYTTNGALTNDGGAYYQIHLVEAQHLHSVLVHACPSPWLQH